MKRETIVIVCIALVLTAFTINLNIMGLRAEEPRRALVAYESVVNGDYIIPTLQGTPYYNKPPLYSWVLAGFYQLFGSHAPWVVRIPGLLSLFLSALVVYWIGKKYLAQETALVAGFAFLTSADILFYAAVNAGEIDFFFTLITLLQVLLFFHFFQRGKYVLMFLISYALAAAGFLTKGFPSVAFQGCTVVLYLLFRKKGKLLFHYAHFLGIVLFLLITGGFFMAYEARGGNTAGLLINLFKESSQRSVNEYGMGQILPQVILFPFQLMKILLPWSLLVFFLFSGRFFQKIRSHPLLFFSVVFFLGNIWIYWISPHVKNRYLYMFLPFLLYLSLHFSAGINSRKRVWRTCGSAVFTGAALLLTILFPFLSGLNSFARNPLVLTLLFPPVLMVLLFFLYKKPGYWAYLLIIGLLVTRIWFNFALLPYFHEEISPTAVYQKDVQKIAEITGDEPVYYYDTPHYYQPDISLFGRKYAETTIFRLPEIPYVLPYYLSLEKGDYMRYKSEMVQGDFYITHREHCRDTASILYSFRDNLNKKEMVLLKATGKD